MVVQYPHTASFVTPGTDATQDANGNWVPGSDEVTTTLKCRAESASNNGYIASTDGTKIDYSWIVYLPLGANAVKVGTNVTVTWGAETILTDTVKRFSRGQLNCRLWL